MNRRKRSTFTRRGHGLALCPYRYAALFNDRGWFGIGEWFGA